jgi:hypothetical protein
MLNWKNVQYANGSGLVNAIRGNNAQINENNKQVVDSISQFGDDYSKTQTDAAIARLAGSTDPQQAQDILRSYAQGGNGFVDQGLLADSYRDQTQEFRDNATHADTLLTNKSSRAVNEYKLSPEYQALQKAQTEAQIIKANADATKAATDAQMAEAKMNAYNNIGQNVNWQNVINPTTAPVNTGITPDADAVAPNAVSNASVVTPDALGQVDAPVTQPGSTSYFSNDVFDKFNSGTARTLEQKDAISKSVIGFNNNLVGGYTADRDTAVDASINRAMQHVRSTKGNDRTEVISKFTDGINATNMTSAAKTDGIKAFSDKVDALRVEEENTFNEVSKQQTKSLQELVGKKDFPNIPGTADVVASTNLTATAVNSILEPSQQIQERDLFTSKYHNDTNLAVQDADGLYVLTKAGVSEYAQDITKLQNKRRHWKDFPKFEKAIQATLNVESSKKLMEQTRTINAADSKQINQARNTASNTVVKYRNETYTPSATYSKFKDIVPSKIEGIVDSLSNADAFFKGNNKWMLYQAIQQIGGVDSDWASFNELEAKGMRSTKIWDQNEDVTAAEIYKKAIALRKQHSSSPTYLTDAGKEYTMPLVPVPSDKITADKQDITSRKILESLEKKVTNKNTNVYGQNVFGNLS